MFDIGEKIVCINDAWQPWVRDTYNQLPVKGEVYTVRGVDLGRNNLGTLSSGGSQETFKIVLEELHNDDDITASGVNLGELGFRSDRFATMEQLSIEEVAVMTEPMTGTKVLVQ